MTSQTSSGSRRRVGADLHLDLAVTAGRGVRVALTDALRGAVRSGRLRADTALPASRVLAADLGLARATVVDAYAELVAEGWLAARQGAPTRVAAPVPAPQAAPRSVVGGSGAGVVHDLRPGRPDASVFPRDAWWQAVRRAVAAAPDAAFDYGDPAGRPELRTALATYLARVRGVRTSPEQVVVTAGASEGLRVLAGLLTERAAAGLAVEELGLHVHRRMLDAIGPPTVPLAVDDAGARTPELPALTAATGTRAVLLTPAHQFPTGVPLRPARRTAAVAWAREVDGIVVEDDYDGEFRYDRRPVGAVQGLAPDRVAYVGTASKALAPGLRLGWMVLPEALARAAPARLVGGVGVVDQLALADLLESGGYDRQVRTTRRRYRLRREELAAVVAARSPGLRVVGHPAGLHALVELPEGAEAGVLDEAGRRGIALEGLGAFRHPRASTPRDGIVVGFAAPSASGWSGALTALADLLGTAT
jgi:GntR family transcriptional regulator / MocR family aminotransferase